MRFGIVFANTGPFTEPDEAVKMALAAEAAGFDSLWTVEHVVVPAGYESAYPYSESGKMPGTETAPIPDPLIWLSYLAAATSTIKLATGVMILPQRNPVVLAKEVATLDYLSRGRMVLGIGVGWLEEEFDAIGVPFNERGRRTDEYAAALRALWTQEQASFDGDFFQFENCIQEPSPVDGTVPIHVGGHTDFAARRAGRLGDGFFPATGGADELADLFETVKRAAGEADRDFDAIEMSAGGIMPGGKDILGTVETLEAVGVDRCIVPAFAFYRDPEETLARFGEEIIAQTS